jgi:glycosyltransferase involved in cell wall biosynthesis
MGACDYYRAVLPLTTLPKVDPSVQVQTMTKADLMAAIESDNHTKVMDLLEADIVLLPRLVETRFLNQMRELNKRAKIVVDFDDNLFAVSPLSPHYVDHGTENVKMTFPNGQTLDVWADGVNIDLAKNRATLEEVKKVLGQVDLITVTTDILANAYRPHAKKILPLPNCIDAGLWKRLPFQPRGDVRMGWFGGHSHYEDWTLLTDVLPVVMEKFPLLKLVIMGTKFEGTVKKLPADRIEFHPWVPTQAYHYKAAILDLDFAVIPLRDTVFNACKSNIKWVEMGALEVPAAVSYVSPYAEHAEDGNGVWIESNDADGWVKGISMLAESPKLRAQVGAEARKTVMEKFEIHGQAHQWGDAYKGIL